MASFSATQASQIKLHPQAKTHLLFPQLDYLVKTVHIQQKQLETINSQVLKLQSEASTIAGIQNDLRKLLKEFGENAFNIEKTSYQVNM